MVWWQVYPIGFSGADPTGTDRSRHGGLDRVTGWLDHAVTLGATGLALGPIFSSSTHGYDTLDYFSIDERLGDDAEFDRLVAATHERGLRLMLDGVFNHMGRDAVAERGEALFARDPRAPDGLRTFEGHPGLVAFDHANPAVAELVAGVMNHWLSRGADAFRLDAAYSVPPEFWSGVLPRVRAEHPDLYVVGEVIHGDYGSIVERSGMDSVTQYELWKAIWSSLSDHNFFELAWALDRHNGWLESFVPFTFVGNHDVTRLATTITDPRHVAHALVVLFTVGGTPGVYYGDELALTGTKQQRAGGDDAVRPEFPDRLPELDQVAAERLRVHQELIGLRHRHPWLRTARTEVVRLANEQLVFDADGRLRVLLNLADEPLAQEGGGELLAGTAERTDSGWRVPPHGWAVTG